MHNSTSSPLHKAIDSFCDARILCIGDIMLDRYIYGRVSRVSQEAPIPVLSCDSEEEMLGGAGNLARNIASLGAHACLIGTVGIDNEADSVRHLAEKSGRLDAVVLPVAGRPTTLKSRYIAHGQQLLRADKEIAAALAPAEQQQLIENIDRHIRSADIVVLSDYAKGVLSEKVIRHVVATANSLNKPVLVDPKRSDFSVYAGTALIKPNAHELTQAAGLQDTGPQVDSDETIAAAALAILKKTGIEAMLVSRSEKGVTLVTAGGNIDHFPAKAREVFDVSGAGDTVVATMAVALATGAALKDAAELANIAAGIVVARTGTATCGINDLRRQLQPVTGNETPDGAPLYADNETDRQRLRRQGESWRRQGLTVGFANGCFDLLHPGHLSLLFQAAAQADRLVVGLNADSSVRRLKGPSRPVQPEQDRAALLLALDKVDAVCLFSEETPLNVINALQPDVLVKGEDWDVTEIVGAREVQGWGGRVFRAKLVPDQSTTGIVKRLRDTAPARKTASSI